MRTKLVYCMVSNDKDIYAEQTLFSVTSARAHNPSVHIVLMVDDETEKSLRGNGAADNSGWARKQLTESVDELKVVVLDSKYTNKQKSRLLKTSVRNVIEGDFVFIDSDTSIPGALSELDNLKHEMAAVRDCHWDLEEYPASFYNQLKEKLSLVGAHIEKIETYYNSGVIYAKDTPAVHEFYKRWQENYLNNLEKGMDFDQPTLALTNEQMGNFISHLPDKYNCQLNIAYVPNARIFHYIASGMDGVQRAESPFFAKDTYLKIKRGRLSEN